MFFSALVYLKFKKSSTAGYFELVSPACWRAEVEAANENQAYSRHKVGTIAKAVDEIGIRSWDYSRLKVGTMAKALDEIGIGSWDYGRLKVGTMAQAVAATRIGSWDYKYAQSWDYGDRMR